MLDFYQLFFDHKHHNFLIRVYLPDRSKKQNRKENEKRNRFFSKWKMIKLHLESLHTGIQRHIHTSKRVLIPLLFEYHSAIHLTKTYQTPFYVFHDIPSFKKKENGFPILDKGVDVVSNEFDMVAQCKCYTKQNTISYHKLAPFFSFDKLVHRPLQFILVRTDQSRVSKDVEKMIQRNQIDDVVLCYDEFIETYELHHFR